MEAGHSRGGISWLLGVVLVSSIVFCNVQDVYSEAYIGGQVGTSIFGNSFKDVGLTDLSPPGSTLSPPGSISDRELSRSILGGGKIGYYFKNVRWFGIETEVFYATPHIKQQLTTITIQPGTIVQGTGPVAGGTTTGTLSGDHFRVLTWAPINLMFRYPKYRIQPYIGVGPGIFFSRVHTTVAGFEGTQSSTKIGLNAKAGLEYFITRHLSAFAEWKYNWTSFNFEANNNGGFGFRADYQVHFAAGGLSYHF